MELENNRVQAVDILRGIVMVIMALDHVRDFFHSEALLNDPTDLNTTTPLLFFTRWITHFCAPVFVFLSGLSAYLSGQKKAKAELSAFLIKRGFWLIFVEVIFITFAISFNPFYNFFFLQVIWAIGWSMVILGILVRTSVLVISITGIIILIGHNIVDYVAIPEQGAGRILFTALLSAQPDFIPISGNRIIGFIYAILPWAGIMMLGYGFGTFYNSSIHVVQRKRILLWWGVSALALFVCIRFFNLYGDRSPWSVQENWLFTFLSYIKVTKYPPSLLYTLLTLGIGIIVLALTEHLKGSIVNFFKVYGRVPFFYYVCHFYLIHLLCVAFFFISGNGTEEIVDPNSPFLFRPVNFGYDLFTVYLVWLFVVLFLYLPCKWFNQYKHFNKKQWWLSYV